LRKDNALDIYDGSVPKFTASVKNLQFTLCNYKFLALTVNFGTHCQSGNFGTQPILDIILIP